ncbi:MAG: glycosyltransferase [Candidatus Woesearchaeota archaeon]|nr:glycosyltransferase [Candidatus Woesearchaeota archaeon]
MKISIVIPALNEEKCLPILLESIRKQDFKDYEIIVADANSTDRTAEIARKYGAKVVAGGMPGPGRNKGAAAAKGEFLYFFDSDVRLPKGFLRNTYKEMKENRIDLATCRMMPLPGLLIDRILHSMMNGFLIAMQRINPHAPGFCILVKRDLFNKVNGFDETIRVAEDHNFAKRASKYSPLRVLKSAEIEVSVRRLEKEGRLTLAWKYFWFGMHRLFLGEVRNDVIKYEFAKFEENKVKKKNKR